MFQPLLLRLLALGLIALPCAVHSASPGNARLHDTRWAVQSLDGVPLRPAARGSARTHLVLHAHSQHLSGFAGCHSLGGRYLQRGTQLALSPLSRTRRACSAVQRRQEQRLIEGLGAINAYRIEGQVLSLLQGDTVRISLRALR